MAEPCLADLTNQTGALGASHQQPAFCPTALPDALGTAYILFAAERANLVARTQHAGSTIAAAVVQLQQKPVQVAAAKPAPASQAATSKQRSLDSLDATKLRRRDAALAKKLQVAIGTRKPLAKETSDASAADHSNQLLLQQVSTHPPQAGQVAAASPAVAILRTDKTTAATPQLQQQQQQEVCQPAALSAHTACFSLVRDWSAVPLPGMPGRREAFRPGTFVRDFDCHREDLASYLAGHCSQPHQVLQQQQLENVDQDSSKRRRLAAGMLSRSLHSGAAGARSSSSSNRHTTLGARATCLLQPQPKQHGPGLPFPEQHELPLRQIFGTSSSTAASRMLPPASEHTEALKVSVAISTLPARQAAIMLNCPALAVEGQPAGKDQEKMLHTNGSIQLNLPQPPEGSGLPLRTPKRKRSPRLSEDGFLQTDGPVDLATAFDLLCTSEVAEIASDPQCSQAGVAAEPTGQPHRGQASSAAQPCQQQQQGDKAEGRSEGHGQQQLQCAEHLDFETFRLFDSLWQGPRGRQGKGTLGPGKKDRLDFSLGGCTIA